jgi:hypothetical protein
MQKVDIKAVYMCSKLGERVEVVLTTSPRVVRRLPMRAEGLYCGERGTLRPVGDGFFVRPACEAKAELEIIESRLRSGNTKGFNGRYFRHEAR